MSSELEQLDLTKLPLELVVEILFFLNSKDRTNAAHACKLLRKAVIATQKALPHREKGRFMHRQHAIEFHDCLEATRMTN